jgi:stress response protein YsnF
VRIPLRAEEVTVERRVVTTEEVVIRQRHSAAVERVSETVRQERLRVEQPEGTHASRQVADRAEYSPLPDGAETRRIRTDELPH